MNAYFLLRIQLMYARVKFFTTSLHTFEIPDFVWFQSPKNRFLFSEPVRPLVMSQVSHTLIKILGSLYLLFFTYYEQLGQRPGKIIQHKLDLFPQFIGFKLMSIPSNKQHRSLILTSGLKSPHILF